VVASRESRKRRLARYEEVRRHYDEGKNLSLISRELAMDIKTVRKYTYADAFPERARQAGASILDPYSRYLDMCLQAGCENASQLWREFGEQCFPGSKRQVLKWMREKRLTPAPTTPGKYLEGVWTEKRAAVVKKAAAIPGLPSAKQLPGFSSRSLSYHRTTMRQHSLAYSRTRKWPTSMRRQERLWTSCGTSAQMSSTPSSKCVRQAV